MNRIKTVDLALCALFAALSAVLSQITIPIGPVPINMTHISIFAAAGLLGTKKAAVSQVIFILAGAAGIPVFSGFSGGVGVLLGYRGGFIIGYIGCAMVAALLIERFGKAIPVMVVAMASGMIITYTSGILWYMFVTKTSFVSALLVCVVPFLIGDTLKIALSATLVARLHPFLQRLHLKAS